MKSKILVVAGPTAAGKTEIAVEISRRLPVEMISCDSMQVYRGMPIVTQAPDKKTTRILKTHLAGFLNPSAEYNAARFRKDALSAVSKILKKKKIPLIAGGTGLYLRALLDGLFETGGARDESLRQKLVSEQERGGGDTLYRRLTEVDPTAAGKIHPNDVRRIVRALEVYELTRKPISAWKTERRGARDDFDFRIFLVDWERQVLYERINRRVERMFREGLVEEVKGLLKKNLSLTARSALGLGEVRAYLEGKSSLAEAKELLKKNTRHYAKRQMTWFRHERGVETVPVSAPESAAAVAEKIIRRW